MPLASLTELLHSTARQLGTVVPLHWNVFNTRRLQQPLHRSVVPLLQSATFCFSLLLCLRLSKHLLGRRGAYLRQRVLLLDEVQRLLDEWEIVFMSEVVQSDALDNDSVAELYSWVGHDHADALQSLWAMRSEGAPPLAKGQFYGISDSFAFAETMPLQRMLELCLAADYVLALPEDLLRLRRLETLTQYVLCRRLLLMSEARHYARLRQSVLFPATAPRGENPFTHRIGTLAAGGRPSWLVPLAAVLPSGALPRYLCLPLSYFPVETVLPYMATESWLNETLLKKLVPRWSRSCRGCLRAPPLELRGAIESKVSFWFLRYTAPLLQLQLDVQRRAAQRFAVQRLRSLIDPNVLPDHSFNLDRAPETGISCLSTLLRCLRGAVQWKPLHRLSERERVAQVTRWALLLRAVTQSIPILLQLASPQVSFRSASDALLCSFLVLRGPRDVDALPRTVEENVDLLLDSMATQMLWAFLTGTVEVLLGQYTTSNSEDLIQLLSDSVVEDLQKKLVSVDEAFHHRWLRSEEASGKTAPATTMGPFAMKGLQSSHRPAAGDVINEGRGSGHKILALHDAAIKRWAQLLGSVLVAWWRKEWAPLAGALLTLHFDVLSWASGISAWVGFATPQEVARTLSTLDTIALPSRSPHGLRLLIGVISEKATVPLQYPYLSLVACSAVWAFHSYCGDADKPSNTRHEVAAAHLLCKQVIQHPFKGERHWSSCIPAMKENIRCILVYVISALERDTAEGVSVASSFLQDHQLDPDEVAILLRPEAVAYLPTSMNFFEVFSLPSRFILRQLGLEVIFAHRLSTAMHADTQQKAEDWWSQILFHGTYNPLTSCLMEAATFFSACATVALLSIRIGERRVHWAPQPPTVALAQAQRLSLYRNVLRGGVSLFFMKDRLCSAQQICEWLPTVTADTSPSEAAPALEARRQSWRSHLAGYRSELIFDDAHRIVSGLELHQGIHFHNVNFVYPQLFASSYASGVRPVLRDVNLLFPAAESTVIVGPSGSGKSSLLALMRRHYDPVPVIEVPQRPTNEVTHTQAGGLWEDEMLVAILHAAIVDNFLPPPLSMLASEGSVSLNVLLPRPGLVTVDSIPLGCFAASYIRQWLGWLSPFSTVLSGYSFHDYVSSVAPLPVLASDVEQAMSICQCQEFIGNCLRNVNDVMGSLSSGQWQRVRLARVVAHQLARSRLELLYRLPSISFSDARRKHGSNGDDEACASSASPPAVGGLLLDEPTRHLDAITEAKLNAALDVLHLGTTLPISENAESANISLSTTVSSAIGQQPFFLVVVSHRFLGQRFDQWVVVQEGQIMCVGEASFVQEHNSFVRRQMELHHLPPRHDAATRKK